MSAALNQKKLKAFQGNARLIGQTVGALMILLLADPVTPQEKQTESVRHNKLGPDAGLEFILNKRYLPADFDQATFDQFWRSWPKALAEKARQSTPEERRKMAFTRYGFTPRKDDPTKPVQFVVDSKGQWALNCFACHGGSLYGSENTHLGLPNTHLALETLYEDSRATKRLLKKPFSSMDVGSALVPMGTTTGTSNAVIFGVSLMAFRDQNLDLKSFVIPPIVDHHDMDAPPWWNTRFKKMLYIDGFLEKHHRALMPFIMVKQNDGPKFRSYESDFEAIEKYIHSLKPPAYPGAINRTLADRGAKVFRDNCARCHGEYHPKFSYPEKVVPLSEVGTDPVRLSALSQNYRRRYGESWLANYGKTKTITKPKGYVAPPLIGIWASAPYLHNGSIPTLRGVLIPEKRPAVWKRTDLAFDDNEVGFFFEELDAIPQGVSRSQRRNYFDTRVRGKSNSGHDFGQGLSVKEQNQLLEYLKTL